MLRKTLTILSLIGLLLSVGLWGVSYFNVSYAPRTNKHVVHLRWGRLTLMWTRFPVANVDASGYLVFRNAAIKEQRPPPCTPIIHRTTRQAYFEPGLVISSTERRLFGTFLPRVHLEDGLSRIAIPLYLPVLALFAIVLMLCFLPLGRRRKRKKLGLCVKCGYDLRGSKDRCPECGEAFEK